MKKRGRPFKKIEVVIEFVNGESTKDKFGWNECLFYDYDVLVRKGKREASIKLRLIKKINGTVFSDKYLDGLILLELIEQLRIAKQFNFFKEIDDIQEFYDFYGFNSCSQCLKTIKEIKSVAKAIKSLPLSDDELDRYCEINSEGEPEAVEKAKDELEKYFKIEKV